MVATPQGPASYTPQDWRYISIFSFTPNPRALWPRASWEPPTLLHQWGCRKEYKNLTYIVKAEKGRDNDRRLLNYIQNWLIFYTAFIFKIP